MIPQTREDLQIENQKMQLYFKHIETLEDKFDGYLKEIKLKPFE